ncbi:hypothetical protein, partial [Paenibacillus thalictri]
MPSRDDAYGGLLHLGCAKVDITPPHPLPLAGYGHRKGDFQSVKRPIHARILYFRRPGGGAGTAVEEGQADAESDAGAGGNWGAEGDRAPFTGAQCLIVSADLLCFGTDTLAGIRAELRSRFGFCDEQMQFHATHSHSGPQTTNLFTPMLGRADAGYVAFLERQIIAGVEQASQRFEPVTVEKGSGLCEMGIFRRKMTGEGMMMAPNPHIPVDSEVTVLRFVVAGGRTDEAKSADGATIAARTCASGAGDEIAGETVGVQNAKVAKSEEDAKDAGSAEKAGGALCSQDAGSVKTKALLLHYACHPTTSGDNDLSSEYPGAAMDMLEEDAGGGMIAAFLQGFCGDVRPALVKDGAFYRGSDAEIRQLGRKLADAVQGVLAGTLQLLAAGSLAAAARRVPLAMQPAPTPEALRRYAGLAGADADAA